MLYRPSKPEEHNERLPIEYPLQEALSIYFKRLIIFLAIAATNMLLFLAFIAIQRVSFQPSTFWSLVGYVTVFVNLISLIFLRYFVYQRNNPINGWLVFSNEEIELSKVSLYSGWNNTKKRLDLDEPFWGKNVLLAARSIRNRRRSGSDEPERIYIRIKDKSQKIIFEGEIMEGATKQLPDGIFVSYQSRNPSKTG